MGPMHLPLTTQKVKSNLLCALYIAIPIHWMKLQNKHRFVAFVTNCIGWMQSEPQ